MAFLGLIDTVPDYRSAAENQPGQADVASQAEQGNAAGLALQDGQFLLDELRHRLEPDSLAVLEALARAGEVDAMLAVCRNLGLFAAGLDQASVRRHLAVRAGIRRALEHYHLPALDMTLTLICARDNAATAIEAAWRERIGDRLDCSTVDGDHYSIMDEPHIQGLASLLSQRLLENVSATGG